MYMNNKSLYILTSAVLFTFASCKEEMDIQHPQALNQIVMTTQDFQPEADSRTFYQITEKVTKCIWTKNDTVGVFPEKGMQMSFPMVSEAGAQNAIFNGGGWALKDGSLYTAYYPFIGNIYLNKNSVPVSYIGQTQDGNASTAHLGTYDYMVATPCTPQYGSAHFSFKHLSALVQLKLIIPQPTTIASIKLVSETDAFAVTGKVDVMATTPSIAPDASVKEVKLDLQNIVTTINNQIVTLYMMLPPTDLSEQTLKAFITTDNGVEEIDLPSKNFQAGTVYALSGELNEADDDVNLNSDVVNITEAGTMQQLLGDDYLDITSLKIVGSINGDDVRCLRQMLGASEFSETERGKLTTLDLSKAQIVEGGDYYHKGGLYGNSFTTDDVIGNYMFYKCLNLQNIELPENAISIEYAAFSDCSSLASIKIGNRVASIGSFAFSGCSSLASIEIPDGVTSIPSYAFQNCSSLTSIDIPDNVTSIEGSAFSSCSSLVSVTIGKGVTNMDSYVFSHCSSLASIEIPNGVTSLGSYAFKGCSSLEYVTIGQGVASIPQNAFEGCSSLVSVIMRDNVTKIESAAFKDCSSLASIEIPNNVVSIGWSVFSGCI